MDTNSWKQIPFLSADVIVTQFTGPYGCCTLFNIYNDSNSQDTLTAIDSFLETNHAIIKSTNNDHILCLGDFNRHHPLWEETHNSHLFNYPAAQPLIDIIADFRFLQLLPRGIPTLQSTSTGNWTCPDNVFGTEHLVDTIISCNTDPSRCGPKTDHVPILTILEFDIPHTDLEPRCNWRDVDWEVFNKHLKALITTQQAQPLVSKDKFQAAALHLTQSITNTIDDHVPFSKPCPHSKHWWTHQLTNMHNCVTELSQLAHQMRGLPLHTCHEELKATKNMYAEEITSTKQQHWLESLEDIEGYDLWTTNRYISSEPSDGGKTRIPTLTSIGPDNMVSKATMNNKKSRLLAKSFFPPPPKADLVPPDTIYPDPVEWLPPITPDQISQVITNLSDYKAPGPDGICNIVFKECANILIPYLTPLFNAVYSHRVYYQPWRCFTTVVLQKPSKPNYTVPKAYHPVADQLTYVLEHHNLLPNIHFGG
jgi:hypothetical protein